MGLDIRRCTHEDPADRPGLRAVAGHRASPPVRRQDLSLLTLAELSPRDAEITLLDEQVDDLPEGGDFDLVGITAMTATAPRAYEIARLFRQRGVPVVLGGFHPTLNPDEALQHADAVVVGPAYGAWERLLADLQAGSLQRVYRGDLEGRIPASLPRHLVRSSEYLTVNATFATLGCRNTCRFCSITQFHGGRRRLRPIEEVVSEVAAFPQRFLIFVDDNLTQDRGHAAALLRGLAPLGKRWVTQASIEVADDEELMGLLRDAGCVGLFIGLESFSERALCAQSKTFNTPARYREAVARLHRYGLFVEAGIIFGHDTEDIGVFRRTLETLDRIGIDAIQVSILTPTPGTPLFEEMSDRIFDRDWEHYDYRHAVFTPAGMSAEDLQAGTDWVIRQYYTPWRIARRLLRWVGMPHGLRSFVYPLSLNAAYFGRVRRFGIRGHDPALRRPAVAPALAPSGC
jgi:radical SAM superfamily enzyme YgiQ (UPF0313 family)